MRKDLIQIRRIRIRQSITSGDIKTRAINICQLKIMQRWPRYLSLLNRFLAGLGIQDKSQDVLRAIDKLNKIGRDGVCEILIEEGLTQEQTDKVIDFISIDKSDFAKTLSILEGMFGQVDEISRLG